jgi:hypothetical protein
LAMQWLVSTLQISQCHIVLQSVVGSSLEI